jgi:hypothetical protein
MNFYRETYGVFHYIYIYLSENQLWDPVYKNGGNDKMVTVEEKKENGITIKYVFEPDWEDPGNMFEDPEVLGSIGEMREKDSLFGWCQVTCEVIKTLPCGFKISYKSHMCGMSVKDVEDATSLTKEYDLEKDAMNGLAELIEKIKSEL